MSLRKSVCTTLVMFAALLGVCLSTWAAEPFVVQFRLLRWESAHLHDSQEAATAHAALAKIGCETRQEQHDDHFDLHYRCPQWRAIQVTSDDAAHKWEGWLRDLGFETSHRH